MSYRPLTAILVAGGAAALSLGPGLRTGHGSADPVSGNITLSAAPLTPGQPHISDSLAGKPILTVGTSGLAVGETLTNNVVITNQSNAPLTVTLAQQNLKASSKVDLSAYARLTVTDASTHAVVYSGVVSKFPAGSFTICGAAASPRTPCPPWAAGEVHTFSFSVVIPDQPGGSSISINHYQGSSFSTDYLWTSST